MALLLPTPAPVRSVSTRTSASSLFPFSRLLSDVVDIDELSDTGSVVEFGWDPAVVASCISRGKTVHSKLLLEGAHVSGDGALKPSKLLPRAPRPQPPSVYRPRVRRPLLEREDSVSSSDTLLPVPSPRSKSLEEVASPDLAVLLATRPQSSPPASPARKRSLTPLFAPSPPLSSPLSPPKSKRRRITPPLSKYKHASAGRTWVSLALVLPRNLVNIPPFYPPRARLEAEFALFGYLSHLHECARRCPPPSPVPAHFDPVRPVRRGHTRTPSHGTLHSLRSLRSLRSLGSLRIRSIRPRSSMTLRSLRPLQSLRRLSSRTMRKEQGLQLSHLLPQIKTERLRVFERIQGLKRVIVDNGEQYAEKDMRKAQEYGAKLARDTLPRILHVDLEFDDWVFV